MTYGEKPLLSNPCESETSVKYLLKLSTPLIITYISFTAMQFVDRFMVSRLGTDALAAVLPAGMVSFLPASFAIGVIASVTTYVSQSLGRGRKKDCSNYCWQAIYMGLAYSVITTAIMWPSASFIFKMMDQPAEIIPLEVIYFRIMLYSQFICVFIWCSTQFFVGIHNTVGIMFAALAAQVVNVICNYLLIFGKFGFPQMGIAGAAWGTFIGVLVGASMRMYAFLSRDINAAFSSRSMMKLDFHKILDLLKVGLPAGCELMLNMSLWGVILFALVGRFGVEAAAATSAVFSWTNISVIPVLGVGRTLTAVVGKSIGEMKKEAAIAQTRICLIISIFYMGIIGLCFLLFKRSLMTFWSGDEKVIEAGITILTFAAIYQVFYAARIIYGGALQGAGDTLWLAIVSALGAVVVLGGGGLLILKLFPQFGIKGPWIAATLSITAVGLANRWRFRKNNWMAIDIFKRHKQGIAVEIETLPE